MKVLSPPILSMTSPRKKETEPVPAMLAAAVRAALERMLRCEEFRASKRNRKFLRRVVEAELEGRGHEINGYVIGSEVFGRGQSFDHVKDPIVRIEASKLRRDLEHYYLTAGRGENIIIHLPRGAYRPTFEQRLGADRVPACRELDPAGLTVASLRLDNGIFADSQPSLRAQITDALTRLGDVAVYVDTAVTMELLDSATVRRIAGEHGTALVLSGDAWSDGDSHRVVIRLHDGQSGRQVWSEEFPRDAALTVTPIVSGVAKARRHLAGKDQAGTGPDGPV